MKDFSEMPAWKRAEYADDYASPEELAVLAEDSDHHVVERVAANPQTPAATLAHFISASSHVLYTALENPSTPPEALRDVASRPGEDHAYARKRAASIPSLPNDLIPTLAVDESPGVRAAVAGRRDLPIDLVIALCNDSEAEVREAAALNLALPIENLVALAADPEASIRELVASFSLPMDVLLQLTTDSDSRVRYAAGNNLQVRAATQDPCSPPTLLATLVGTGNNSSIARNPSTAPATLEAMAYNCAPSKDEEYDEDHQLKALLAGNPNTPPSAISHLVSISSRDGLVPSAAARNPASAQELLLNLATKGPPSVRTAVAGNRNAGVEVLTVLFKDKQRDVRKALAERTDLPIDLEAKLHTRAVSTRVTQDRSEEDAQQLREAREATTSTDRLVELASSRSSKVREAAAIHVNTPPASLIQLATDKVLSVRLALVGNAQLPAEAVDILSGDPRWDVREALNPGTIYNSELSAEDVSVLVKNKSPELKYKGALRGFELGMLPEDELRRILPSQGPGLKWIQECAYSTLSEPLRAVLRTMLLSDGYILKVPAIAGKAPVARSKKGMDSHKAWELASNPEASAEDLAMAATAPSHSYVEYLWEKEWIDRVGQIRAEGVTRQLEGDSVTRYPQILVALHPNTSAETLVSLRKARSMYVRASLAQRPDLDAFPTLAKDKEAIVRRAVAEQAECPVELLNLLSLDSDVTVRSSAALHPHSTDEIRAQAAILGVQEPS